ISTPFAGTSGDAGGDPAGVSTVTISIQDVGGNYFDGSGFNSGSAVLLPAQGTVGNWTYNNSSLSFTNDHRYDVTAKATDNAGNSATATNRFTYDLSKPTSTISTPQAP